MHDPTIVYGTSDDDLPGPTAPVRARIPRGILRRVDQQASHEERSRSKMLVILVREALAAREQGGR